MHHLAVLRDALSECDQFDMGTGEVYEALDYIAGERPHLSWTCTQFRQALEHWRPEYSPGQLHALLSKISDDLDLKDTAW
ncbi:MAG: hypothetical protein AAF662_02890 [Pseudomonadota bacterium]